MGTKSVIANPREPGCFRLLFGAQDLGDDHLLSGVVRLRTFPVDKLLHHSHIAAVVVLALFTNRVGVIAVPESAVTQVYEDMANAGIKGVLNFARVFLRETEGTTVSTVNIELKIENLCYFVNIFDKEKKK